MPVSTACEMVACVGGTGMHRLPRHDGITAYSRVAYRSNISFWIASTVLM